MNISKYINCVTFILIISFCTNPVNVYADPPKLVIEQIIEAKGDYVTFVPETDAIAVAYVGLSGVDPFPSEMLKDSKSFILSIRGLKEGQYRFTAVAIKQNEYTRKDFVINIGKVTPIPIPPIPDPIPIPPDPTPKPDPKLDDAPTSTNGLHVLFVYESGQRVTENQFNILYGNVVRTYLDTNCDRLNNQPQWRVLPKDSVALSEPWKDALKRKREGGPWVVIMSGKKYVYEGGLGGTPDELIKLLDKYKPKSRTDYCPNCPEPYKMQATPLK